MENLRKQFLVIFILIILQSIAVNANQESTQYDYVFLLDFSGSMIGLPKDSDNIVIFPEVVNDIKQFIDALGDGANVTIYQFHRGIQAEYSRENISENSRIELKNYIDNLQNEIQKDSGQVTWIFLSLREVLQKLDTLYKTSQKENIQRIQTILLYTDGEDTGPDEIDGEKVNMDWILNKFSMQKSDNDYLYLKYITLNVQLPPEEEKSIEETEGVEHIVHEGKTFQKKHLNVEIKPIVLNFGNLQQTDTSQVEFKTNFDTELYNNYPDKKFRIHYNNPSDLDPSVEPEISPLEFSFAKKIQSLNFKILKTGAEVFGEYQGDIEFIPLDFRDPDNNKEILVRFTPEKVKYKFLVTPPLIIEIKSLDEDRLEADFGSIVYEKEKELEYSKEYEFVYNQPAQELRVPISISLSFSQKEQKISFDPDTWYFEQNGQNKGNHLVVNNSTSVILVFKPNQMISAGDYEGEFSIKADNVEMEGKELNKTGENIYSIPIKFRLSIPWIWPGWLTGLLVVISVLILGFIGLFIYCKFVFTKFPIGSYLLMSGIHYYLPEQACMKGIFRSKVAAGGTESEIEMTGLPPGKQFFMKPVDKDSISIIPVGECVIKDSLEMVKIKGEQFIVGEGGYFSIEISADVFEKIEFKKEAFD